MESKLISNIVLVNVIFTAKYEFCPDQPYVHICVNNSYSKYNTFISSFQYISECGFL